MGNKKRVDQKKISKSAVRKVNKIKTVKTPSKPDKETIRKKILAAKIERSASKGRTGAESFEKAVANARGLPDGAISDSDDSDIENKVEAAEEGEEAMDVSSPPPTKQSKDASNEKGGKGKFTKLVGKALGKGKSKTDTEGSAKKRRNGEKIQGEEEKKPKLEEMTVKERKKIRKMSKTNYEISHEAKKHWEELRRTNLTPEKRYEVSRNLYNTIAGKTKELIYAHDTSRIIQCLIKYGAQEHKNALFEELKGDILELAKSKYAKFFVRKLLKYGTKSQREHVFKSLYGNVRKLIRHKEAAEIIELAYNDYANVQERQTLLEEFYGPSFALFKSPELRTLDQIMASAPEKKESIMSNIKESLTVLASKGIVQFSIVHRIFKDYFHHCTEKERSDMIQTIRESVIHMLHTNDGSEIGRICFWHGTVKDRKVLLKSLKTYVAKVACEEYGHLVLLALFDTVDDTKAVGKIVLDELFQSVAEVAKNQYGRKVLLYLMAPRDHKYFHPDIVKKLTPGDGNQYSKKSTEVRRRELLDHASKPLMQHIATSCAELVSDSAMLLLILCTLTHITCDPTEAMIALSKVAAQPYKPAAEGQSCHVIEDAAGHMTYKKLIQGDKERRQEGKVLFSTILLDILPKGTLLSWAACNRGCFLIIFLLEVGEADITAKVRAELAGCEATLAGMQFKGAEILQQKLTAKTTSL